MAEVNNWQLGRTMSYPYEEVRPKRQWAAVFNLNRCIACQTCTMAHKSTWTFSKGQEYMWWNNVETKPYGGYPQHWDVKTLELLDDKGNNPMSWDGSEYTGDTIFELAQRKAVNQMAVGYIPTDKEWRHPNIFEDTAAAYTVNNELELAKETSSLPEHKRWFFYLPRVCNHCTYAACLAACPRKAIYKRKEDGIVLIDQKRCRGYRKCVEQCPYKKPMYRAQTRVTEKCIGCYPRIEGKDPLCAVPEPRPQTIKCETGATGPRMEARCMAACVGKIRLQGFLDDNPKNPITWLVKEQKVALPLYPQFGTEPNIYYIPPRWVPRAYLKQMFGPGVDEAIAKYQPPSRELLAVLQLFRTTQTIINEFKIEQGPESPYCKDISHKYYDDTVIGYAEDGTEVARLNVEEPEFTRSAERLNSI